MIPNTITFDIGETVHKQPLRLVYTRIPGSHTWTLHKHAANQRDDECVITGLSTDTLRRMAECAEAAAKFLKP